MARLHQILIGPVRPPGQGSNWGFAVYQGSAKTQLSYDTQRLASTARDAMLVASNAIGIETIEFEDALARFLIDLLEGTQQ